MPLSEENPLKPVQSLKHTTKNSAEQTVMRTKWFKHIAIQTVRAHLLVWGRIPGHPAHPDLIIFNSVQTVECSGV